MSKIRYAHLSAGFMLTSIIGFLLSIFFVYKYTPTWGFTFAIFFGLMFASAVISLMKADFREKEYMDELAVHEAPAYKKKGKKK